jgi:putative transcriptional regulator
VKIKDKRKELKLTQDDLANMVDVTRQTIIALEQGKYNPSLKLAYQIKTVLKVDHIEDLFIFEN